MATQQSAFDSAHLRDQWGSSSDEIYRAILDIFVVEAEGLCIAARSSLDEGQRDGLARAAHTLGGASANVGALQLARCAGALEESAQSGEQQQLEGLLRNVEAAWQAVKADLALGGPGRYG